MSDKGSRRAKRRSKCGPFRMFLLCLAAVLGLAVCRSPEQPEADGGSSGQLLVDATADYIELDRITKISKFRSGEGHDCSDGYESCRSMKHYFVPRSYPVKIFSPVGGTIEYLTAEWAGTQVGIRAGIRLFIIFHVNVLTSLHVGDSVNAGQQLGTHFGSETWSDIAVREGDRLVSYFRAMTDSVFQRYRSRGVSSRDDLIISKQARDADPLTCSGDAFQTKGNLPNWVILN